MVGYFEVGVVGLFVALDDLLGEGQAEVSFFVVGVVVYAGLGVGDCQAVVL